MYEHQPELEVLHVPEAIGLALEDFDLVVEPFQGSGGDAVAEVGEQAPAVAFQGFGQTAEC